MLLKRLILVLFCVGIILSGLTSCRNDKECCVFIIKFHDEYSSLRSLYAVGRKAFILKRKQGKINDSTWEMLKQADKDVRHADAVFGQIYQDAVYNNSHTFTKKEMDTIFKGIEAMTTVLTTVLVSLV